jgi:hypothetical protein
MVKSSLQLLHALYAIAAKYGKSYCYPSQEKILELLKTHYDISISRRTLNRWLSFLEGEGYIYRTRRHAQGKDGGISFKSTLYRFGKKALRLLKKIAYPLRKLLNLPVCHSWHNNGSSKKQVNRKAPQATPIGETPEVANRRFKEIMDYYLGHRKGSVENLCIISIL